METTVKKREWVKDAAIVFLAVLLVLTFFSNTIMNRSLPEVATAAVSSGSIVARVRGSGVVTATGKQQVKAKETRTIRSVMVKVGQEVNTGDVLFVLGEGDETALEQAMNTLRALQYDYQRQAMNVPTYDGSSYDRSVDSAYERMVRAEQARNKAAEAYELALSRDSAANIQVTSAEIAQVEAQLKDISEQLSAAQAAYDERVNRAWEALSQAEWEYDHSGSEAEVYVDDEVLIDEDSGYQASTGGSEELWKKVEEARAHLSEVQNDIHLSSLQSQYDSLLERYNTLLQHRDNYTPDSVIPYQDALETAESELTDARLYYDEAVASRDYAYQSFEQKVAVEQVNLAETAENIRIQQEKIKSLAGEEENVVSAAVSGTISTIDGGRHRAQGRAPVHHRGAGHGSHPVLLRHERPGPAPAHRGHGHGLQLLLGQQRDRDPHHHPHGPEKSPDQQDPDLRPCGRCDKRRGDEHLRRTEERQL